VKSDAGGSRPRGRDDLAPGIAKSARLQQEIDEVLSQANKKEEDVTCFGMRFPGQWKKSRRPSSVALHL
jgi:hypothetical protein